MVSERPPRKAAIEVYLELGRLASVRWSYLKLFSPWIGATERKSEAPSTLSDSRTKRAVPNAVPDGFKATGE